MSYDDNGERISSYFLKARNRADLAKRTETHRKLSEASYGLLGRSPDYIASFVTGMNLKPEIFGKFADNVTAYFSQFAPELAATHYGKEIWSLYERGALTADVALTGRVDAPEGPADVAAVMREIRDVEAEHEARLVYLASLRQP